MPGGDVGRRRPAIVRLQGPRHGPRTPPPRVRASGAALQLDFLYRLRDSASRRSVGGVAEPSITHLDALPDALGARLRAVRAERLPVRDRQHIVLERDLEG